jgi:cytochrome c biogenesis protein CcmG/thiol:disulfide interchange protein DsbE
VTIRPGRALAWRAAVVVAVAVSALVVATRAWSSAPQPVTTSTQPTTWQLPRLSGGGVVRMSDLHGHPVVLDFFASWCTACRGEIPGMVAVAHDLAGKVTFAGIDSLENGDGLAMARQYGITGWPLARDVGGVQDSGLHDALGARGMPLTAFYSSSGRLVSVVMGAISEDDLRSRISSLFGIAS